MTFWAPTLYKLTETPDIWGEIARGLGNTYKYFGRQPQIPGVETTCHSFVLRSVLLVAIVLACTGILSPAFISLGLGNGFFAIRYAFDRATLGPLTTAVSVGHVLAMLGTAVIAHIAYADPMRSTSNR